MAASTARVQVSNCNQLSDYTVRLQLYRMISENKAANAPVTFEEIIMVMINNIISRVVDHHTYFLV